ncbi:hypothetical protein ACIQXW_11290 [Lysinibacillus sp. NPDC097162]|uniref:hypothetical protein n=1 Tax=Lysinibacillus sp. NPDC097162 TaxID=3364140 RepID=UPI00382ABDA8
MKKIFVSVSPEAEEFYLLCNEWVKLTGHKITIDDLSFSAIPFPNLFRIFEFESGARIFDVHVPDVIESYEETMLFLEIDVAVKLVKLIEHVGVEKIKAESNRMKEIMTKKLGPKPKCEKINTEWLKADISETLN